MPTIMSKHISTLTFFAIYFQIITINLVYAQPSSNTSSSHLCFKDESIALLQLKNSSFTMDSFGLTSSWKEGTECCKWYGITCHPTTNHVTTLDLGSGGIRGALGNNSTLFLLQHLETLNLAYSYFFGSLMSPKFGQFTYLKHLNLTDTFFTGEVPLELGKLSKLETLDLSFNTMKMPNFKMIINNMTKLKRLGLDYILFDSIVFPTLANLSSLEHLTLFSCRLKEELPFSILNLPHLEYLEIGGNSAIYSKFSLYNWTSPLQYLALTDVNFSSQIPTYPGRAPYKLLSVAYFSGCNFIGEVPSWIWSSPKLEQIRLGTNKLNGDASKFIQAITSIELQVIDIQSNNFTGNFSLYKYFQKFPNLMVIIISKNNLVVTTRPDSDTTLTRWPMILGLGLSSCNLTKIPDLLKNQSNLIHLDLSKNNIHGEVPKWLLQQGKDTLENFDISNNFFSGSLETISWQILLFMDLSSNMFQGTLPIPPPTTVWFATSNNNFSGPISSSICTISSLNLLDLSNNSLGGEFPKCLGNFSNYLRVLNLGTNKIGGKLPLNFTKCSSLEYLDLRNNGLQGSLSRSLSGCTNLQYVNLKSNNLMDELPIWLHNLPQIQVLDLSFNSFYGSISQKIKNPFPMLRILDLSSNKFSGEISSAYIKSLRAMMNISEPTGGGRRYMGSTVSTSFRDGYSYSLELYVSGVQREYQKIITTLTTLDLSNNGFVGEIPDVIGDLVMIHSLNLSHNKISGKIPSSIGNLKMINSLDLSVNRIDGKIPQELASLTSMGFFNVSNNQLVGEIPETNNFNTFQASSYQQNLGLCGFPLTKCGQELSDSSLRNHGYGNTGKGNNKGFLNLSVWEITAIGYGCGTILGLAWGYYWLSSGNLFLLTKITFLIETKVDGYFKNIKKRRKTRRRN